MKTYIAGHRGMVGSALIRQLEQRAGATLITRTRAELDLLNQQAVHQFFAAERPELVYLAAAKVGGILANMNMPADFLYENLMVQCNVVRAAHEHSVKKLCMLGSSCIYPRECPQPMKEEHLLTGPLEPTNEAYALAKIAGLKMAIAFEKQYGLRCVSVMPCNLYGPNDSFDPVNSHVLSALVRKFVEARDAEQPSVVMWGTGSARREFLHVDDMARATIMLMDSRESAEPVNVGSGTDVSIRELAEMIAAAVGYRGRMEWDSSKPDGMPRKCLDVSKISAIGFRPRISLEEGIRQMIDEYQRRRTAHGAQESRP